MRSFPRSLSRGRPAPAVRAGYSATQIALHWIVAALIVVQFVLSDGMEAAYGFEHGGPAPTGSELFLSNVHMACGIAVFALALLRVALRFRRGVPLPPPDQPRLVRLAARATHGALYAVIFLMPLTGMLACFGGVEAMAAVHRFGQPILLVLVGLHVAGAAYHHFVLKSDVPRRMLKPERSNGASADGP